MDEVVSKGQFATLANVSAGRVSQWISEGKIAGEAIVGEGRSAKIRVAVAMAQLRQKIDIGQRFGNGLDTNLTAAPAPVASPPPPPVGDPVEERIKRERLREIEFRNRDAAEKELARRGAYVRTRDSAEQMAGLVAAMLNVFEGALPDFAMAVAARFQIPQRDVLHLLRGEMRGVRERASLSARKRMETLPADVLDDIAAASDEPEAPAPAMI